MVLEKLSPSHVWTLFEELCTKTYRPSSHEQMIREKILKWLHNQSACQLHTFVDNAGNLLITKPASKGYEKVPALLLQAHLDMVCESDPPGSFDFVHQPLPVIIDSTNQWVSSKGTTLGADDGIGVAIILGLLVEPEHEMPHGPLEILLTVGEEAGLDGAYGLDVSTLPISSHYLLNIDSEDLGIITIGSAGGGDTILSKSIYKQELQPLMNFRFFSLKVSGLLGGHSGVDIHLPRANANVLIARIMNRIRCEFDCWITSWNGGTKDNAIPRESEITFAVKTANSDKLQILYQEEIVHIKEYYHNLKSDRILEPTLAIEMKETAPGLCVDEKTSHNILSITNLIPNGPLKMSPTLPQLVETSSNFALVKMDDKEIQITSLLRSSIDHELVALRNVFWSLSEIGAWQIHHKDAYPGWAPDPNAPFTKFVQKQYEELLQQPVKLEVIHAGLECGLIGSKIKNLQMLSIGPTIKYPHSPSERVNIASVNQIYTLLKRIISRFSIFA